jgi:translation elongation factor EF-G
MDAIVDYLPSPEERPLVEAIGKNGEIITLSPNPKARLCALAFKVCFKQQFNFFVLTHTHTHAHLFIQTYAVFNITFVL